MGTRAQFFVGDPQDIENREWLGCIAWDGYPDGDCNILAEAKNADEFRALVKQLAETRDDFCDPAKFGFPFPWKDNLFLTDCTYAFLDGETKFTYFHNGFVSINAYLSGDDEFRGSYNEGLERLPSNVPAPSGTGKAGGPDSIIVVSVPPY